MSFDAQKAIIEHYAEIDKAEIVEEFIETESTLPKATDRNYQTNICGR